MIDIHAHFLTERSRRADWREVNQRRLDAGDQIGITVHVASILGTWGMTSPTYFPSPDDVTHANTRMGELAANSGGRIRAYCVVNPNFIVHTQREMERCVDEGAIGIKLAASRRANDTLLDPVAEFAAERGLPVLHHIWQRRRRDWPGQEASDAVELAELAERHPAAAFILAHIGGGGDWSHSLRAIRDVRNVYVDLSGSGVDAGLIESVFESVGVGRSLWGCDLTLDTGLAKLRYIDALGIPEDDVERVTRTNAIDIFPDGAFDT